MDYLAEGFAWIALAVVVGAFVGCAFYAAATLGDAIGREIEVFFGVGGPWEGERRGEQYSADGAIACHAGDVAAETMPAASGKDDAVTGAVQHG